jgi:acyl-CoA thioesterase-1
MGFSKLFERFRTSIIRTILILVALVVRADFAFAQNSASTRILALGDSLTAGYRLPKEKAFPALIEKSLRSKGYRVEVVNAGVSGDTARQALARLEWSLKKAGPFQVALVELGANDGLRRSPVAQMRESLEKIVVKLKSEGIQVYLLGMKLPENWEKSYREDFERAYVELAKKHAVPLYPFLLEGLALNDRFNLEDRIHPNPDGHALIAEKLEGWLMKKPDFARSLGKVRP